MSTGDSRLALFYHMQLTGIHSYAIDPNHTQNYAVTYNNSVCNVYAISDSMDLYKCIHPLNLLHT